ncbi:MAG TPA: hypothetical protein VGD94_12985 [Vicinamibacterales bacterium]
MTRRRLPEIAMRECISELRAACRLPIDDAAMAMVDERVRHNFFRILSHPDGPRRWADHGQRMRDNARHLGALADFYGSRDGFVGVEAMQRAFQAVRDDCTVRAEVTPVAFEYCQPPPPPGGLEEEDEALARVPETV